MSEENIHAGHRERLLKTVHEGDFSSLSQYQQVEVLLFYIFPRGDVNPLAHRLLDYFGSFSAILDADVDDLASVKGMGKTSAMKIKDLLKIFERYTQSKIDDKKFLNTLGEVLDAVEDLLRFKDKEELILISLDKSSLCNGIRTISRGTDSSVGVEVRNLYKFIETFKSDKIIIAHNHPAAKCNPSANDLKTYQYIKFIVESYGCKLYDSYVLGINGIYSFAEERILRTFCSTNDILQSLQIKVNNSSKG